jgi:hypothetical protein
MPAASPEPTCDTPARKVTAAERDKWCWNGGRSSGRAATGDTWQVPEDDFSTAAVPWRQLQSSQTTMGTPVLRSQALIGPGGSEAEGQGAATYWALLATPAASPLLPPSGGDCAACGRPPGLPALSDVAAGACGTPVLAAGGLSGQALLQGAPCVRWAPQA